jgi:hypothetical protein
MTTTDTFSRLVSELAGTWWIEDDNDAVKAMDTITAKAVYADFSPERFGRTFDLALQMAMGITNDCSSQSNTTVS